MKRGQGYAFENQWERALREYQRALAEFPNDQEGHTAYAQALFRFGQWEEALTEYGRLLEGQPRDPFIINRIAECNINLGRTEAAERALAELAEIYDDGGLVREAVNALRTMAQINPRRPGTHKKLAQLYRRLGDINAAIGEHMILSRLAIERAPEDLPTAVQEAETAFALNREHRGAREWLARLRAHQAQVENIQYDERTLEVIGAAQPGGNASPKELNEMLALAEQYRDRGQNAAAMRQYEAVIKAGLRRADVYYNLGLLYQQLNQPEQAITVLKLAGDDPEYAMSSYYALGMCYRQMDRLREATQAFENAVASVDLATVHRGEIDDLAELYDAAAKANIAEGNQARAASLYSTLHQFLAARRWHTGRTAEFMRVAEQLTESSVSAKLRRIGGDDRAGAPPRANVNGILRPSGLGGNGAQPDAEPEAEKPGSDRLRPITDFLRANGARGAKAAQAAQAAPAPQAPVAPVLPSAIPFAPEPIFAPEPPTNGAAPQMPFAVPQQPAAPAPVVDRHPDALALDSRVEQAVADGDRYLANDQLDAALDSCMEVIRLDPDYLPVHTRMAEIYRRLGRRDEAVSKLQSVIDVYMVRGEPEMAAKVFPKLIELNPDNANLRSKLATLLLDLGDTDAAVEEYMNLADSYFAAGQTDRALEELRRLRKLSPDNPSIRVRGGNYLLRLNRPGDALVEFGRALNMDPTNNLALVRTYVALVLAGETAQWEALQTVVERAMDGAGDEIVAELQDCARTHNRPELYLALAAIYQRLAETDNETTTSLDSRATLVDALDKGIAALPGPAPSAVAAQLRYRRANLYLEAGDSAAALPQYQQVAAMLDDPSLKPQAELAARALPLPEKVEVLEKIADSYALTGDVSRAIESLQTAKAFAPYDRVIYTKLAELYFRQGRLGAALVALDELIVHYQDTTQTEKMLETLGYMTRLAPNNITVRRKLADAYIKRGMIDQGLVELNTLAELQTKNGMLKDAVGTYQRAADIYWTMGQHRQAFGIYDKILRVAPNDVDARQYLINLYIATGRMPEAVREQKNIAEIMLQQRKVKESIAALHQVIALAPSDAEAHHALAQVLASQGEYDQSARLYARLRRLEPERDAELERLQVEMQRRAAEKAAGVTR